MFIVHPTATSTFTFPVYLSFTTLLSLPWLYSVPAQLPTTDLTLHLLQLRSIQSSLNLGLRGPFHTSPAENRKPRDHPLPSVIAMKLPYSNSPAAETAAALLSLALLATPASAMLQCEHIQVDGQKFNFKSLSGPHSVVTSYQETAVTVNTTYTLDLCAALKKDGDSTQSCPNGAKGWSAIPV